MPFSHLLRFQSTLLDWYQRHHRPLPWRESEDPYKIWVSEVMLQQTQVNTVIPFYRNFIQRFPDIGTLAEADLQEVLKFWEGLGYYSRARNLHKAARQIMSLHNGTIPADLNVFRQLAGVGPYIGAAVQSIAFDFAHAAVDGNVKRVLARLLKNDVPVNAASSHGIYQKKADELLATDHPGLFNQALMELGALICKPRSPMCMACPVSIFCQSFADGSQNEYPRRIKKAPVKTHPVSVGVIIHRHRMLITRRNPEGLLGGLWEFPGGKVRPGESAEQACIREIREEVNVDVDIISRLARIKHAYTHFKIEMDVFFCAYLSGAIRLSSAVDYRWITFEDIEHYPFPKANHKFIPLLENLCKTPH